MCLPVCQAEIYDFYKIFPEFVQTLNTTFPARFTDCVLRAPSGKWREAVRFPISRFRYRPDDRFFRAHSDGFLSVRRAIIWSQSKFYFLF